MATGVGLRQISLTELNSPTQKTPRLVQESGTYLLQKPSYSKFSVKIFKCSLSWQQRLVRDNFHWLYGRAMNTAIIRHGKHWVYFLISDIHQVLLMA